MIESWNLRSKLKPRVLTEQVNIQEENKILTRKAIFLSLFIAENCLRRERTAESRGLSGAILSSTIQGWPETKHNSINTGNFFDAKI